MDLYPWFKTLHILFAIVAVGLNISYGIWQARAAREPEHMGFALRGIKFLDDRVANPSYARPAVRRDHPRAHRPVRVHDLLGRGRHRPLPRSWARVAILFYSPTLKRQIAAYEAGGAQSAEFQALGRAAGCSASSSAVIVVAIIVLMVVKPSLTERSTPPMAELPVPGRQRSWWLREALAAEGDPPPAPPLAGDTDADVAIVGGGYTGMWAAYFLGEREPDARIVLLEQDICGGGPCGRNGGFVHGWWESLGYLAERFGHDAALEIAREADEVVDGIGAWCAHHGVDA